jgi:hypothetical protein
MIEASKENITFGRFEVPQVESAWIYRQAFDLCLEARTAYMDRWGDHPEIWENWHTVTLHGPFGKWTKVEFDRWHLFGTHPHPTLIQKLSYSRALNHIDPVRIPSDPPILHHSWRVIPDAHWQTDPLAPHHRKSWKEQVRRLEKSLNDYSIMWHPSAHTYYGWKYLLSAAGLRLVNLPDNAAPKRIFHWKVEEVDPRTSVPLLSEL